MNTVREIAILGGILLLVGVGEFGKARIKSKALVAKNDGTTAGVYTDSDLQMSHHLMGVLMTSMGTLLLVASLLEMYTKYRPLSGH